MMPRFRWLPIACAPCVLALALSTAARAETKQPKKSLLNAWPFSTKLFSGLKANPAKVPSGAEPLFMLRDNAPKSELPLARYYQDLLAHPTPLDVQVLSMRERGQLANALPLAEAIDEGPVLLPVSESELRVGILKSQHKVEEKPSQLANYYDRLLNQPAGFHPQAPTPVELSEQPSKPTGSIIQTSQQIIQSPEPPLIMGPDGTIRSVAPMPRELSSGDAPVPEGTPIAEGTVVESFDSPSTVFGDMLTFSNEFRLYARGEALLWWLTDGPNPAPLLTTGNPADGKAGAIGAPSTSVLYGGKDVDLGLFTGARFTLGAWLGDTNFGVEGSGFFLTQQNASQHIASSQAGVPLLAVPFQDLAGNENQLLVATPNGLVGIGSFDANYQSEFWGAELNGMFRMSSDPALRVDLLGGFAFRRLREELDLRYHVDQVFLGSGDAFDNFQTTNDFYGGQVGARVGLTRDRLSLEGTVKVAFGVNHQTVNINGGSAFNGIGPANPTSPFGIFAQESNIGSRSQDEFTVIPELNLLAGYRVTERIKVFAGYNLIYWANVARPGNQIDRTINTNANGGFFTDLQGNVPALGGRPEPRFNLSDVFAHGVNLGFEFKF